MHVAQLLVLAARLAVVLAVAIVAGIAVVFACAVVGHELLVLRFGPDLAPIDDTPPMRLAVWTAYLAGLATGLLVVVAGCRRFVLRPRPPGAQSEERARDPAR